MICEIETVVLCGAGSHNYDRLAVGLEQTIQKRLDDGWTLQSSLSENGIGYLIFVKRITL